ncbi:Protein cof, putative [Perkinsus marinus ATCC 50983]|uniref:Protein cof, putative n=1 Tax=Perkinsus marinus (strain ATCC 50983 / TXsc) TaxID=423536 RepID=C5LTB4_PERM5|nr:Protein cof, putative [Perkinsus marinus ATCC 50983]EER00082.1 Protein cof, putative [Perkinsus marinus ATCC 50983]|eukprot:XP_002767364.1 Protein cof, putative [Perkinsus marinus ATCC 50983]
MPSFTPITETVTSCALPPAEKDFLRPVELVCTDMDGTVLGPDHSIHEVTFEKIHRAQKLGCAVIPATGRCRMSAAKCFSKGGIDLYSLPGVYLNGCVVYDDKGNVASNVVLDYQIVCDLVNGLRHQREVIPLICSGDRVLAPFTNDFVKCMERMFDDPTPEDCGGYDGLLRKVREDSIPVHMIHVITPDPEYLKSEVVGRLKGFAASHGCAAAQSLSFLCDIIPAAANKGYGIRVLKERLGYNSIACIGDAMNDKEMLQNADVPVVMGNAMNEIKTLGRLKVNANDHAVLPGVADLISRIIAAKQ